MEVLAREHETANELRRDLRLKSEAIRQVAADVC
jgi:hypothetical protein